MATEIAAAVAIVGAALGSLWWSLGWRAKLLGRVNMLERLLPPREQPRSMASSEHMDDARAKEK
ncbi:MAG: hypothetical protein ACRDYX_06385 [Egibacteraceae bacterium]